MTKFLIFAPLLLAGCAPQTATPPSAPVVQTQNAPAQKAAPQNASAPVRRLSFQIVREFPHDSRAFTQGLLWRDGFLYEGTGLEGRSSVRRVELETGRVVQKWNLPPQYFGEGLAFLNDRFYKLTWTSETAFVLDPKTLQPLKRFSYRGEGWGLTTDGKQLLMSNGSDVLTWRNPQNFAATGQIRVTRNGQPLRNLNELEWIDGKVWANVWTTDVIVVIDPKTGVVQSEVDLSALRGRFSATGEEDVLNGIAFDAQNKRLFVTGKNWPKLFWLEVSSE